MRTLTHEQMASKLISRGYRTYFSPDAGRYDIYLPYGYAVEDIEKNKQSFEYLANMGIAYIRTSWFLGNKLYQHVEKILVALLPGPMTSAHIRAKIGIKRQAVDDSIHRLITMGLVQQKVGSPAQLTEAGIAVANWRKNIKLRNLTESIENSWELLAYLEQVKKNSRIVGNYDKSVLHILIILLDGMDRPIKEKEISQATGISRGTISGCVRKNLDMGIIEKSDEGLALTAHCKNMYSKAKGYIV